MKRRDLLAGGIAAGAALTLGSDLLAAPKPKVLPPIDLNTVEGGLAGLVKVTGSLDPSHETLLFSEGTGYAVAADGRTIAPWLRTYMLIVIRNLPAEEGYRQLSNQLFLFADLKEDRIVDEWVNPVTNATLPVFHGHNGPMNIELKPYQMKLGADAQTKEKVPFKLPWKTYGPMSSLQTELRSSRPNVLNKAEWGDAFTGPMVESTEWVQWTALTKDLVDPAVPSVLSTGNIVRHGPWYPWMMMGERSGSFLTRMIGQKLKSRDELPAHFRQYAEKNFAQYLQAPTEWTGAYVDLMSVYKKERAAKR